VPDGRQGDARANGDVVLGVDVGGTKVAAAVVDGVELRNRVEHPTRLESQATLLDGIAAIVAEVIETAGVRPAAIGVGVPSQVDADTGTARASVNIPLTDVPVRAELGKRLGVPVLVDNDANCAALAEARLAPQPTSELVMLTLGTGVGGGIVLRGRVFHGASGLAGELGHVVVDAANAEPAPADALPRPGSLEWHCGGRGLEREATLCAERAPDGALGRRLAERGRVSGRDAVAAARDGDAAALALFERYADWLGAGIGSVVNAFEPERIVIGGGISRAAELFLDRAIAVAARWSLPALWEGTIVELARGGADAGVIGAALLARHGRERSGHTAS
jgi:glucokinase